MKTKHVFLIISFVMVILEGVLGFMAFSIENTWQVELSLIVIMVLGIVVIITMIIMYRDKISYEEVRK